MPFTHDDLLKFKGLYIKTGRKYLEDMLTHLDSLMSEETETSIYSMRIAAHSLNGQSMVAGYTQIGSLSSLIEQIFTGRGEGSSPLTEDVLKKIRASVEKMLLSVEKIEKDEEEIDLSEEIKQLKEI
jgi:chemotaxis protein histidine kinase CheA